MADRKGLKRICMSCGARFYDLNKKPIICPSCNTEFTGEIKVKARRGRLPSEVAEAEVEDDAPIIEAEVETEEAESDDDTVSLDEIEEGDDDGDDEDSIDIDGDDLDIDDLDDDDIDDDDIDEDIAEEDDEK